MIKLHCSKHDCSNTVYVIPEIFINNFQGPSFFSRTFQALKNSTKKSRIFNYLSSMARNSLLCADVSWRNYSLTV